MSGAFMSATFQVVFFNVGDYNFEIEIYSFEEEGENY